MDEMGNKEFFRSWESLRRPKDSGFTEYMEKEGLTKMDAELKQRQEKLLEQLSDSETFAQYMAREGSAKLEEAFKGRQKEIKRLLEGFREHMRGAGGRAVESILETKIKNEEAALKEFQKKYINMLNSRNTEDIAAYNMGIRVRQEYLLWLNKILNLERMLDI